MKYALVNNIRKEATKGAVGKCPCCKSHVRAYCGERYIHHWKHISKSHCDPWWENETLWHRNWKNHFPEECQEVVHKADDGEKHIADVKTKDGWVIEFQHSLIKPDERRSRNKFYPKLVWFVNGLRRKTDLKQFKRIQKVSKSLNLGPKIMHAHNVVHGYRKFRLFKEWGNTKHLVFLDFNKSGKYKTPSDIWCILPFFNDKGDVFLWKFNRSKLIKFLNDGRFEQWFNKNIIRRGRKGKFSEVLQGQCYVCRHERGRIDTGSG